MIFMWDHVGPGSRGRGETGRGGGGGEQKKGQKKGAGGSGPT